MTEKQKLIDRINEFYFEIIEEYKEITAKIKAESSATAVFKKKDYEGNINRLKRCKAEALRIDVKTVKIDESDEASKDVSERFERALSLFNSLCDSQIQLQTAFMQKAKREAKVTFGDCSVIMKKVNTNNNATQVAIHDLDLVFADYIADEEYGPRGC